MGWMSIKTKWAELFKKYRYVALVVALGVFLMFIPAKKTNSTKPTLAETTEQHPSDCEERLAQILAKIHGVGRVSVMLTVASGPQTVYQSDESGSPDAPEGNYKRDTVIVTDENRREQGLVSQTYGPEYMGAVIVCEGADDPSVRYAVVDAVSNATGLGADRISVLKMK